MHVKRDQQQNKMREDYYSDYQIEGSTENWILIKKKDEETNEYEVNRSNQELKMLFRKDNIIKILHPLRTYIKLVRTDIR